MDMVDQKKWILDSNVLVYWIVAKYLLQWLMVDYFKLSEELVKTYQERYKDSIIFIDKILSKDFNHKFYIIDLTLNEIFSGVKDEVKTIILFKEGHPLSRWTDRRIISRIELSNNEIDKIKDSIFRALDKLMTKFEILSTPYEKEYYLDIYSSLTLHNIAMGTQDAILLTTALLEKGDFFVTKDDYLKEGYKKILNMFKKKYKLEIINPTHALNILKN